MIGTSTPELILIYLSVLSLRLITPLSTLYTFLFLLLPIPSLQPYRLPLPLEIYFVSECLFCLLVYFPLRLWLQRRTRLEHRNSCLPTRDAREALLRKCLQNVPHVQGYLRKWFLMADLADVGTENVKRFFAWAFLDREVDELTEGEKDEVDEYVELLEERLEREAERDGRGGGTVLKQGWGKAKCVMLSFDGVPMMHRALMWYFIIFLIDIYTSVRLSLSRFHHYRPSLPTLFSTFPFRPHSLFSSHESPSKHLSYWYRPHTSKTRLPILFIHGIGVGLYPYVDLFNEIVYKDPLKEEDGELGMIVLEIMPISARICKPALGTEVMRREVSRILEKHGWGDYVLVGNSYGSALAANLLKDPVLSPSVKGLVLIDPICFLLFLPDVAYNFTRRTPHPFLANQLMLHYFSSMDMMVSHTLARHFTWSEYIIWKEDLSCIPTTVCVGGRDLIVNTDAVWRYLTDSGWSQGQRNEDDEETSRGGAGTEGGRQMEWVGKVVAEGGGHGGDGSGTSGAELQVLWFQNFDHAEIFRADRKGAMRGLAGAIRRRCERVRDEVNGLVRGA